MDDVVAVCCDLKMGDGSSRRRWYLTWGRTFEPVDPTQLIECVRAFVLANWQVAEADVRVCESLAAARDAKYFYDGLMDFARLSASVLPDTLDWDGGDAFGGDVIGARRVFAIGGWFSRR